MYPRPPGGAYMVPGMPMPPEMGQASFVINANICFII